MKLERKKVLVTGAGGFIGSHLVEELVKIGCSVRAIWLKPGKSLLGWLLRRRK